MGIWRYSEIYVTGRNSRVCVRFEVLTAMTIKIIFRDRMLYYRRFGRSYCLHLQGGRGSLFWCAYLPNSSTLKMVEFFSLWNVEWWPDLNFGSGIYCVNCVMQGLVNQHNSVHTTTKTVRTKRQLFLDNTPFFYFSCENGCMQHLVFCFLRLCCLACRQTLVFLRHMFSSIFWLGSLQD
jgi:hypothetical protein